MYAQEHLLACLSGSSGVPTNKETFTLEKIFIPKMLTLSNLIT